MNKALLDILVCPGCNGKLQLTKDQKHLVCKFDKLSFSINDDIPEMLLDSAQQLTLEEVEAMEFM